MNDDIKKKSIPERSLYTQLALKAILEMKPDDILTYAQLNDIMGLDPQEDGRSYQMSARKIAEKEYNIVTDAISNTGIKRLTDNNITGPKTDSNIRRSRNIIRRSIRQLTGVNYDALENGGKVKHNAALSVLGVFELMTRPHKMKRIEAAVGEAHKQLGFKNTMELFQ